MAATEPPQYVAQRVREAIAQDPAISELGVQVDIVAGKLFLTGTVATEERRAAIAEVARGTAPDLEIHNNTVVEPLGRHSEEELP